MRTTPRRGPGGSRKMTKAPICSICQKEQTLLSHPTDRQSLPVFVCAEKVGRSRMPCDGNAFKISAHADE